MYIYVCIYNYIYICIYVYILCIHTHTYIYISVCLSVYILFIYTCIIYLLLYNAIKRDVFDTIPKVCDGTFC